MSADVTKIELAKALQSIKAISTDEQFEQVKKIYIQPGGEESVLSAVNGLSEEDEFALLTKLMGVAVHIVGFEQRPLIAGDYTVPDYLVNIKPGCFICGKDSSTFKEFKFLVDVKSTEKDKFKIGGPKLRKLRNFADLMGLRLFFAVRFLRFKENALWAFIEDDNRNQTHLHADYENVISGLRHVFWDDYVLTVHPNLIMVCEFSKSNSIPSCTHLDYGTQVKVIFKTIDSDEILYEISGTDSFFPCAVMESYFLEEIKVEEKSDDITLQYLKPKLQTAFVSDLVYKTNRLARDEFGNIVYDASKLVVRSDTGVHDTLVTKDIIQVIAQILIDKNVLFLGSIGEPKEHLRLWKSFGQITDEQ